MMTIEQKPTEQQQPIVSNKEMDEALLIKRTAPKPVERIRGIMI